MPTQRFALTVPLALLLAASLVACGSPRRSEPIAGQLTVASESLVRGRAVFDTHCYPCHTGGEGGLGPALNDKPLPRFLIRFQIRHGLGAMPAFSEEKIDAREMEDLLDYIVALRRHG
jgi:mono/diheme cytochrome c family protein